MSTTDHAWAIVLAAGEGSRLRELTTGPGGRAVPKQFCSLDGGPTLLASALERARSVVGPERTVVVVAAEHRALWRSELRDLPRRNVIVQPRNRGTAAGVLLPLLAVLEREPEARVATLPSDHFVRSEWVLRTAILQALGFVRDDSTAAILLGIEPDEPVADYGWILPESTPCRPRAIRRFVEKPGASVASDLLARGGLWNSLVFAARGRALLDLYEERLPRLLAALRSAGDPGARGSRRKLRDVYGGIESSDFSRDLLEGSERRLRVLDVPPCGWTDLGTPQRVAECLRGRSALAGARAGSPPTPVLARAFFATDGATRPRAG